MAPKDLHNNIKGVAAIPPAAAVTNNTAYVSAILDTANAEQNELLIQAGDMADADVTITLLMEEGNDSGLSDASAIADADLIGTEAQASLAFGDDNAVKKIGYKGSKRYIRATFTPANNTGNIFLSATWLQAGQRVLPAA